MKFKIGDPVISAKVKGIIVSIPIDGKLEYVIEINRKSFLRTHEDSIKIDLQELRKIKLNNLFDD